MNTFHSLKTCSYTAILYFKTKRGYFKGQKLHLAKIIVMLLEDTNHKKSKSFLNAL